jgi:hypothetical protein
MPVTFERVYTPGFQRESQGLFYLPRDGKKAQLVPPEDDVVRFCEGLYQAAKYYRDTQLGMMERWRTYRSWYLHSGTSIVTNHAPSQTYVNMIYEKVENLTAHLTGSKPEFVFSPHTMRDVPFAELLNEAVPWLWHAHGMQTSYYRSIKANMLYGTWYWKVIHDPKYPNIGSVEKVNQVPAWYMFPAPYATDIESAPWIIEVSLRTVGEIEADYGVKVEPEIGNTQDLMPPIEEDLKAYPNLREVQTVAGPTGSPAGGETVPAIPESYFTSYGKPGFVIQKELWIRDGTLESQFWFDGMDDKAPPELRSGYSLKYPRGRVISWANGRRLYDGENPYRDGRFPYVKFVDVSVPDFWYGMGEVEPLINLQLLHDDTHEIIKQIHLFTATGRLVVDERTGLDEDRIGNEPGEIWYVKPGTVDGVKWLQGSTVPAEIYNYVALLEKSADLVSGFPDVTRGINPTGVTAARALSTLHSAAGIRIQARLNDVEGSLIQAAKLLASRIQQFWKSDMSLMVAGQEKTMNAAESGAFDFKHFELGPAEREARFNVQVMAIGNKDQLMREEFQKLMLLFQLGLIGPEHLIEGANLTREQEILATLPLLLAQRNVPPQAQAAPPSQQVRGNE